MAALAAAVAAAMATPANALPDGRNYERISPDVDGVNVGAPIVGPFTLRGSADGRRFLFPTLLPLQGSENGLISSYVADRDSGTWQLKPIAPRVPLPLVDGTSGNFAFTLQNGISATNEAVDEFINVSSYPMLPENHRTPGPGINLDLYYRTFEDPTLTWFTNPLDPASTSSNNTTIRAVNDVGSGFHVVFSSPEALDPDPAYAGVVDGLYEWSPGDAHPTLIGVDENGAPLDFAAPGGGAFGLVTTSGAVSPDGTRVVFMGGGGAVDLYVRVNGRTIHIVHGTTSQPIYEGTANDVSRVYFSLPEAVPGTDAPSSGGLYSYDVPSDGDPAHGHLEFLADYGTGGGVVAVSRSGRHVYYVATNSGGTPELRDYSTQAHASRYVASLSPADNGSTWGPIPDYWRQARVSLDGESLVFGSAATGIGARAYDTGGFTQLFRYDADSGAPPVCISCRPDATPSVSNAALAYFGTPEQPRFTNYYFVTRNISDDGRRVFFNTLDPLVPEDVNTVADVYEWVDGAPHLISSGKSTADSTFLDASRSGDDVFFTAFDSLVPEHSGGTEAIYDARVGAPAPKPAPEGECEGDACQGSPPPTPAVPAARGGDPRDGNATPADGPSPVARASFSVSKLNSKQLRALARGRSISLRVKTNVTGTLRANATVRLKRSRTSIGSGRRTLAKAGTASLRLRLSASGRRRLATAGRLRVALVVTHSAVSRGRSVSFTLRATSNHNSKKGTR